MENADREVDTAIVVVIACAAVSEVVRLGKSGAFGNVAKGEVSVISQQEIVERGFGAGEEDIEQAVVVVIQRGAAEIARDHDRVTRGPGDIGECSGTRDVVPKQTVPVLRIAKIQEVNVVIAIVVKVGGQDAPGVIFGLGFRDAPGLDGIDKRMIRQLPVEVGDHEIVRRNQVKQTVTVQVDHGGAPAIARGISSGFGSLVLEQEFSVGRRACQQKQKQGQHLMLFHGLFPCVRPGNSVEQV